MKKQDLKTGMVVKYRDGRKRIVLADVGIVTGKNMYCRIKEYKENLSHKQFLNLDIVTVYAQPVRKNDYIKINAKRDILWSIEND